MKDFFIISHYNSEKIDSLSHRTLGAICKFGRSVNKNCVIRYKNNRQIRNYADLRKEFGLKEREWRDLHKEAKTLNLYKKFKIDGESVIMLNPLYVRHNNFIVNQYVVEVFGDDILYEHWDRIKSKKIFELYKDVIREYNEDAFTELCFRFNEDFYRVVDGAVFEAGIYVLYRNKDIIYIGKSKNIFNRLKGHSDKEFTNAKSIIFKDLGNIDLYEPYLIKKYKPTYNKEFIGEERTIKLPEIENL